MLNFYVPQGQCKKNVYISTRHRGQVIIASVWEILVRNFDLGTGYSDRFLDIPKSLHTTALYTLKQTVTGTSISHPVIVPFGAMEEVDLSHQIINHQSLKLSGGEMQQETSTISRISVKATETNCLADILIFSLL